MYSVWPVATHRRRELAIVLIKGEVLFYPARRDEYLRELRSWKVIDRGG